MANDTTITVIGNACSEVDLRFTPSGAAVAKFRLASTPRHFDKASNSWVDDEPMYLTCNVWREAAESVAESVTKGMRLLVVGRLKCRTYEKDGQKRQSWEIEVDEIGPSLKFATARVQKMQRSGGSNGGNSGRQTVDDPWASSTAPAGSSTGFDDEPPF